LTVLFLAELLGVAGCHHTAAGGDDDAGPDGGDTDVDSDTDADTDTDGDTDTETGTWPEFESDCHDEEINGIELRWCKVPAGTFRMGCDESQTPLGYYCENDSTTLHEVTLSEFEMMDREISVAAYRACVEAGPCDDTAHFEIWDSGGGGDNLSTACRMDRDPTYEYPYGYDDHPMNCIDWYGARAFCEWIGARLPTEAEWERAARGDHDGLNGEYWNSAYSAEMIQPSWGCSHVNTVAIYEEPCGFDDSTPVGALLPTSYGIHDILGNMAEWCGDWYQADYYSASPEVDPQGPEDGEHRSVRGGAWMEWEQLDANALEVLLLGRRDWLPPDLAGLEDLTEELSYRYNYPMVKIGGRCVRSVE